MKDHIAATIDGGDDADPWPGEGELMPRRLIAFTLMMAMSPSAAARKMPPVPLLMPDMPLHDPWIVVDRATGTYHLFTRNERRMTGDGRLGSWNTPAGT